MNDLDELVRRAVASPVAPPPELEQLRGRARRHGRRRVATRVLAAAATACLAAGGVVVVADRGAGPQVRVVGPAQTGPTAGAITHPVLSSCTPASAREGTLTGSGLTSPPQAGEVFADPSRGITGPLATLVRGPVPAGGGDGTLPALIPNLTIAGRPANYGAAQPNSGIDWLLPDGAVASLRAKDISETDLVALAEAISRQTGAYPAGLQSIGTTSGTTTWARSYCAAVQPNFGPEIEAVQGTLANRYAYVVSEAPGLRWDVGDVTYLYVTLPVSMSTAPPAIRQATPEEWSALVANLQGPETATATTAPDGSSASPSGT